MAKTGVREAAQPPFQDVPLSGFREGGRGMGKNLSAVFGQEFFLSEIYVTLFLIPS
jgi:hypothetical protein